MPYSILTDEQLVALLAELPNMTNIPGVALVWVDFTNVHRTEVAVLVTVYSGRHYEISQLPVTLAGLPVLVKVEELGTGRVVETIDPRKNGGTWSDGTHG